VFCDASLANEESDCRYEGARNDSDAASEPVRHGNDATDDGQQRGRDKSKPGGERLIFSEDKHRLHSHGRMPAGDCQANDHGSE